MVPPRIGRYEILGVIAEGGHGTVYRGRDPVLDRDVAIKRLDIELDAGERTRALRALRAVGGLQHPNIVTIYDAGEDDGRLFVAMELIRGETLADMIRRRAPMPVEAKLALVEGVCRGLEFAHSLGIVHQHLSPANVFVLGDGTAKIGGFSTIAAPDDTAKTRAGTVTGRPNYLAPELVMGSAADNRADVFAAGAILYELIGGTPAFPGDQWAQVMFAILKQQPPALRSLVPAVGADVERAVDRALSKKPEDRYPTAAGMAEELARIRSRRDASSLGDQAMITGPPSTGVVALPKVAAPSPPPSGSFKLPSSPPAMPAPPPVASAPAPVRPKSAPSLAGRIGGALRAIAGRLRISERPVERQTEPEPVLFGASAPRSVAAGATFTARFAAYAESREEHVAARLRALSAASANTIVGLRPARGGRWKTGTPVTVRLSGGAFSAELAEQSFEWNGAENIVSFNVRANAEARDGDASLQFEVFIEGISIATVAIDVRVGSAAVAGAPATATGRAPSTAFASYASQDAALVALCLSALQRWDPGLKVFMDCLDLTPNERWQGELSRVIPEQDAFLLFWSANAMRSRWVRWEIDTRRAARGVDSIRPMPLEDPQIAPPPEELGHLHFRDRFLIARQGFLRINEQRS